MTIDRRRWAGRLALALAGSVLLVGWTAGRSNAFLGPIIPKIEKIITQTGTGIRNIGGQTGTYSRNLLRGFPVAPNSGVGRMAPKVISRAGPVGIIIGAGILAYWAYAEEDGGAQAPQPGGEATDWLDPELFLGGPGLPYPAAFSDGTVSATVVSMNGRTVTISVGCTVWGYHSGSGSNTIWRCGFASVSPGGSIGLMADQSTVKDVECQNTTTNAITMRAFGISATRAAYTVAATQPAPTQTNTSVTVCDTGEVATGFRLGPNTGTQPNNSIFRQTKPIGYGSLAGEAPSEYPEGDLIFETAIVDATCKNAETNEIQHIKTYSDWGTSENIMLPSCKQRLGSQWYGVGIEIIPMDPTQGGDIVEDWPSHDSGDVIGEGWEPAVKTPAEEAMPCSSSSTGCGLSIEVDGVVCVNATGACVDLETRRKVKPDSVECLWGTEVVAWKYCRALVPALSGTPTQTVTDPQAPRQPVPDGGTDPETPIPDDPIPPGDPTGGESCITWAGGWNPLVWVYRPVMCALRKAFVPKVWPDFESTPNPLPPGWVPTFPAISGGACGVVNMPGGLNLGPLLPNAPGGKLFDSCDFSAARNVTYYGTLAVLLVVVGTRAYRAVLNALGMAVEGSP